jgi:molybdate transport system ATP-binding protein
MAEEILARFQKRFPAGPTISIEDLRIPFGLLAPPGAQGSPAITVIFGASGAGKTTLLRCLAGLERPDSGVIQFRADVWFHDGPPVFLPPQKRNIGYLSQDYALFPHLTVEQNIAYGLRACLLTERDARVGELVRMLELGGLEKRLPRKLAGGEQQRVALARAVARRPGLLLLDEPLAALDAPTRLRLRSELRRFLRELGIPALVVTHDRNEALALGDSLVVMDKGVVLQCGPVQDVFSRPASLAVAGIVAMETVQPGRVVELKEDLVVVAIGETKLTALRQNFPAGARDVFVCIRGEDVILMKGADQPSSPRNHLPAIVTTVTRVGPVARIALDCGFALSALLTKQAVEEMNLQPNDRIMALVKAPNVHLITR